MPATNRERATQSSQKAPARVAVPRTSPAPERTTFTRITRAVLIAVGTGSLALGIAGIFVPILPTTPFLLLSAACYIRSSKRFYNWLISNRFFGEYIRNYLERRGIPLRVKLLTIALLWTTIGCSIVIATDILWVRAVLAVIALGITVHILSLRTLTR